MSESLTLSSQIISVFSLIANIYLLYVYKVCPVRAITTYKYFFLLTAIQNISLSFCIILVVPIPIASNHALTLVASGPLRTLRCGQYLMVLYFFVFSSSLVIVTNSFIFRYIHVCRIHLAHAYLSGYGVLFNLVGNAAVLLNWLSFVILVFWPNDSIIERLAPAVLAVAGFDSHHCAQLCFMYEHGLLNSLQFCFVATTYFVLSFMFCIILYTSIKINKTLREESVNENIRKVHRKLFTVLLLQTACPIFLLQMPCMISAVYIIAGAQQTTFVAYLCTILNCFYPLLSTLVIIGFLDEYRKHTLALFRLLTKRDMFNEEYVGNLQPISLLGNDDKA